MIRISNPGRGIVRSLSLAAAAMLALSAAPNQRAEAMSLINAGAAPAAKLVSGGLMTEVRGHGGGGAVIHGGSLRTGGAYRTGPVFRGAGIRYGGYHYGGHRFVHRHHFHRRFFYGPSYYYNDYPNYYYPYRRCRVVWTYYGPHRVCHFRHWRHHHRHHRYW
jgi:hypothetical protein